MLRWAHPLNSHQYVTGNESQIMPTVTNYTFIWKIWRLPYDVHTAMPPCHYSCINGFKDSPASLFSSQPLIKYPSGLRFHNSKINSNFLPLPVYSSPQGQTLTPLLLTPYPIRIFISSVENQKGAINIKRCSVENQKDALAVQCLWW